MNEDVTNADTDSKFVLYACIDAPEAMMQWNQEGI